MNINAPEDRRIRKTKKALREGLAELLMEKSIQSITVKELTDKADVHRSTFYANYKDIYHLYEQMEDSMLQEIYDILSAEYNLDTTAFFNILFRCIADNNNVCRLVLSQNANNSFFKRILNLLKTSCMNCWRNEFNLTVSDELLEPYAHFILAGSLGLIGEWAANDFDRPEAELMLMLADIDDNFRSFIKNKFA